jgi:hypothetical protein
MTLGTVAASQPILRGVHRVLLILLYHPFVIADVFLVAFYLWMSVRVVGPTEVGLVLKRFALQKLKDDNPIAFRGEAGYRPIS